MTVDFPAPTCSPQSRRRREAIPSERVVDSLDLGWTSVLLDRHRDLPLGDVFEAPPTPDYTIVVMLRGEQTVHSCNAGRWSRAEYRAGVIGLTPPGKVDRLRREWCRRGEVVEKAALYLPGRFVEAAAEEFRRPGQPAAAGLPSSLAFGDALVSQTVVAMLGAMAAGAPDVYAETAAQWLAMHLVVAHGPGRMLEDGRSPGLIADRRLARVVEYMSAHQAEPLTSALLAAEAGVSRFHFARLFRARLGTSPQTYLAELRLETAQRLLTTSDLPVQAIAKRCGFCHPGYFSTSFARRFGTTPTKFRANAQGRLT